MVRPSALLLCLATILAIHSPAAHAAQGDDTTQQTKTSDNDNSSLTANVAETDTTDPALNSETMCNQIHPMKHGES